MGWWQRDPGDPDAKGKGKRRKRSDAWERCEGCGEILPRADIAVRWGVCPRCGHHHAISTARRVSLLLDGESFEPLGEEIAPRDTLGFKDTRRYKDRLKQAGRRSGVDEVLQAGRAHLDGLSLVAVFWASEFLGGTTGEVAAARFALACEAALAEGCPMLSVGTPAGLRLQEGAAAIFSLARIAAARRDLAEARLPVVSILPELHGDEVVGAVFMGDINLAEPSAALLVEGGIADAIVPRAELPEQVARALRLLMGGSRSKVSRA
ncbi:MAG: hypothetical protein KAI47_08250 [Deltaproteobacteria bacterium]|nr:hypothetical protein [Deltaproteobacteria bacterium]